MVAKELIKNEWYKYYSKISMCYYHFQFEKMEGNIITHYDFCIRLKHKTYLYISNSTWFYKDIDTIIFKCDLDEIVEYLPTNHPERLSFYRKKKISTLLNEN